MKIPARFNEELSRLAQGMEHGVVALEVRFRDGNPRIVIRAEESFHLTPEEAEGFRRGDDSPAKENRRR